jgi:hypothetical protein
MRKKEIHLYLPENSCLLKGLKEAFENHRSYCDSCCFVEGDIIFVLLREGGYIPLDDWETFKSEFGNVSFQHLLSAANVARRALNLN